MSRLPQPKTRTKTITSSIPVPGGSKLPQPPGTRKSVVSSRDVASGSGRQIAKIKPSHDIEQGPSGLQKRVFSEALSKSTADPKRKAIARGAEISQISQPVVLTKRGKEPVVQQLTRQKILQRTPKGEYIADTCVGVEVKPSGIAQKTEITRQAIDPRYATESAGVNQTVSVTKVLSVTSKGKLTKQSIKKKSIKAESFAAQPNLNPQHVNRLVTEENEDVENTLKMVPPDLVSTSVEKFPIKRKLQNLRLAAEPLSLLTQAVILPAPTADEVDSEAPPEVLAEVMDAIEKGVQPDKPPAQIFNSLFPEVNEPRIHISSVAPGPLEDIVVPIDEPVVLVEQALTQEMEEFISNEVSKKQEIPQDDFCVQNDIKPEEHAYQGTPDAPMFLDGELPPWEDATVRKIATIIGADPLEFLDTSDITQMEDPAELTDELAKGIDYFLDADVAPHETKIQIRGSKIPKWFPGYMAAFSHIPGFVKVTRKPSEVLQTAWKAVQPKVFPEDSLLIS